MTACFVTISLQSILKVLINQEKIYGLIAQLVEQLTLNQLVEGSSPSEPKNNGLN